MSKNAIYGYEEYKRVRNRLRKFRKDDLLLYVLDNLHFVSTKNISDWRGYSPWTSLLLFKWVMSDWDYQNGRRSLDRVGFNHLYRELSSFSERSEFILKSDLDFKIEKFFRKTAFQQFWLGHEVGGKDIGRTIELFLNYPYSIDIDKFFISKFGVSIEKFYQLSIALWTKVLFDQSKEVFINPGYFSKLKPFFSEAEIRNFLGAISLDISNASDFAKACSNKNYYNQAFEQSPFKRYPLLLTQNGLIPIFPKLMNDFLVNWFYDFLKSELGSEFSTEFGKVFERYIEKSLLNFGIKFKSESEQKKEYKFSKQVDFLIESERDVLLIEAKAIESSPSVRENPYDENLTNFYKKSLVKGVVQALTVLNEHSLLSEASGKTVGDYFILIVTYKELYLGNANRVWDEFIGETISRYYPYLSAEKSFSKNIFFLSIQDFDRLVRIYNNNVEGMIRKLKELSSINGTVDSKFVFGMFLNEEVDVESDFLDMNFEYHYQKMISILSSSAD